MSISSAYPYTLTNGTTADATQVMADFLQIQNDVNSNAAPLGSPAFTGIPTAPTAAPGTNTTQIATTAYATAAIAALTMTFAPLSSPTFTGTPAAPTAAPGTNTTQIATTAYATAAIADAISTLTGTINTALALKAPLASPALTGTPTAPTASSGTSNTQIATTAFASGTSSFGTSGYVILPGGMMVQWGKVTGGAVSFPTSFLNNCFSVVVSVATNVGSGGDSTYLTVLSVTTSGFTIQTSALHFFVAIGN